MTNTSRLNRLERHVEDLTRSIESQPKEHIADLLTWLADWPERLLARDSMQRVDDIPLTACEVAALKAECRVIHERVLADRSLRTVTAIVQLLPRECGDGLLREYRRLRDQGHYSQAVANHARR